MMRAFKTMNKACARIFKERGDDAVTWHDSDRTSSAIYDSRHFVVETGGEGAVSDVFTSVSVIEDADFPIAHGEKLTIREIKYRVTDLRPDGQGYVHLDLERVAS